jgi:hypothetical protein
VLIRLSHAVGLPEPVPEPFGLAFRATDAYGPGRHQDVLLTTSAAAPVGRHLPLPVAGVCGGLYSSLLPYRIAGEDRLIAARASGARGTGRDSGLSALREREDAGLSYRISLATRFGSWTPVATLRVGRRLGGEATRALRFSPENSRGGMESAGF